MSGGVVALPGRAELADRGDRLATDDERPHVAAPPEPLGECLGPGVEPHREAAAEEAPAIARVQDRAAAGRDHPPDAGVRIRVAERHDSRCLARAEASLALGLEDRRDRPASERGLLLRGVPAHALRRQGAAHLAANHGDDERSNERRHRGPGHGRILVMWRIHHHPKASRVRPPNRHATPTGVATMNVAIR